VSELTLLILRLAFLALLWGFVFAVVYALRTDLFGQRVRRQAVPDNEGAAPGRAAAPPAPRPGPANSLSHSTAPAATSTSAKRLVVTSGPRSGIEMPLAGQPLTIGRSGESGLVIRDDYTSTHHARLMLMNDTWVIQDLDSTNGTFVDGSRVSAPTQIPLNTPVKIGTTSFELRR